MKYLLCSLACLLLLFPTKINVQAEASKETVYPDKEAPVISVNADEESVDVDADGKEKENKIPTIVVENGTAFDIKDRVSAKDNSGHCRLISYGKFDIYQNNDYKIKLIAMDKNGNSTSQNIVVRVVDSLAAKNTFYAPSKEEILASLAANGSVASGDAYSLASSLEGMGGSCTDVANTFLSAYYGDASNCFDVYEIAASEARPGDVIYYQDGGLGIQHYAIYLGGDAALQGNWEGSAKIKNVHIKNASAPIFYRPSGH